MENISTGMMMMAFVAVLMLVVVASQLVWGERGLMIAIGIIVAVLGIIVFVLGMYIAYAYIFNYPIT